MFFLIMVYFKKEFRPIWKDVQLTTKQVGAVWGYNVSLSQIESLYEMKNLVFFKVGPHPKGFF